MVPLMGTTIINADALNVETGIDYDAQSVGHSAEQCSLKTSMSLRMAKHPPSQIGVVDVALVA
jgi:hypothetical protein